LPRPLTLVYALSHLRRIRRPHTSPKYADVC
jgi:hypothetical protein